MIDNSITACMQLSNLKKPTDSEASVVRESTKMTSKTLPLFGLGTYCLKGFDTVHRCLDTALQNGYRLIDTAAVYENEADIGIALKELLPKHGLTRADVYVTSKLSPSDQGPSAYDACLQSLQRLQMDYLDLYLIHWPGTRKVEHSDPKNAKLRKESWKALERLHHEGKCKSIGISNYIVSHMEELFTHAEVRPAVNQSEYHPYLLNQEVVEWCKQNDIQFQSYTTLGRGEILSDPAVIGIAEKIKRKPCQVILKWAMQDDIGVIPMSTKPEHIIDNCGVWDWSLSDDDRKTLHNLPRKQRFSWDPNTIV